MSGLTVGIYGKLPSQPDFVSDNIAPQISNELYDWAQTVMYHTRDRWDEVTWLSAYLVSPLWRMFIPKTEQREKSWIGVMAPSVDAVGRYFPLFLVFEIEPEHVYFDWLFKEADSLLEVMEEVAITALRERATLAQVRELLLAKTDALELSDTLKQPASFAYNHNLSISDQFLPECFEAQLDKRLQELHGSIWWSSMDLGSLKKPLFKVLEMPDPEEYQFLLTGVMESASDSIAVKQS